MGLLIGDFDRSGACDGTQVCIFYNLTEARWLVDASQKMRQDVRFVVGRFLVASWLNFLGYTRLPDDVKAAMEAAVLFLRDNTSPSDPGFVWTTVGAVAASSQLAAGIAGAYNTLVRCSV